MADYRSCKLGVRYYSVTDPQLKSTAVYRELEQYHIKLHNLGKEAILAYQSGNPERANQIHTEMGPVLSTLVKKFGCLKKSIIIPVFSGYGVTGRRHCQAPLLLF